MKTITVRASVPVSTMAFLRLAAGDRTVQEALGFGLMVAMNVLPADRRRLADMIGPEPDEEPEDLDVQFAGGDRWTDDMSLEEVVQLAAAIVATVEHDPDARADYLRLLHGNELQ